MKVQGQLLVGFFDSGASEPFDIYMSVLINGLHSGKEVSTLYSFDKFKKLTKAMEKKIDHISGKLADKFPGGTAVENEKKSWSYRNFTKADGAAGSIKVLKGDIKGEFIVQLTLTEHTGTFLTASFLGDAPSWLGKSDDSALPGWVSQGPVP